MAMMRKIEVALSAVLAASVAFAATVEVVSPGEYASPEDSTEFVVSGAIDGDVSILATNADCSVTLSGATLNGVLTIDGNAEMRLSGDNAITTTKKSAIYCSGALLVSGDGSLAATAAGAKKTGVIAAADMIVAGGKTTLTIANPTAKNACGISLSGNYLQTDGTLKIVGLSNDYKQNGVFLASKKTSATISGGTLKVTLAGEKSVGLALDKATCSATVTGGTLKFTMSGDGAKGIKGDGSFTMAGGSLSATLSGGVAEDYFEYEDSDGNTWNYYVTLTASTKTIGGTSAYNTSSLIANGTYPVMDPAKCYAVKVGTLSISGGDIYVRATGTAGRGLGADSMTLSGGNYDIAVSGGATEVYVESLVDSDDLDDMTFANGVTTCLDSDGAACIKTGDENGTLSITGGKFSLKATGNAGKLINAAGQLVIGTEGQVTLPDATSFNPDISGSTTGSKIYCSAVKQKYYGILATATATTDMSAFSLAVANDNLVKSSAGKMMAFAAPSNIGGMPPGGTAPVGTPPGGGIGPGGDDDADYSNPKGIKGVAGVTVHGGRVSITTVNDGGEGLESKALLTINGGIFDLQCYDDCINSGGNLCINGGWIYASSSGNDAIDSNGKIYMTGGTVVAISTSGGPEVGIDTDDSNGLVISGGHLIAVGGTSGNMVVGSSGTQKTYRNTSVSASAYSGKYLQMKGTQTFTVKMPTLSGTMSLVCTTEGWTTAGTPTVLTSAPAMGSTGFHDIYLSSYIGAANTVIPDPVHGTMTITAEEVDAGGLMKVTVKRTGGSDGRIAVKLKTQDASTVNGVSGTLGVDFEYLKEILVWEDGDTADKTVYVQTYVTDATSATTFRLKISIQTTGEYEDCAAPMLASGGKVIASIAPAKKGTIAIVAPDPLEVVAGEPLRVKIRRTGGSDGRVAVKFKTQDASTVGGINGRFGIDFQYVKTTLVWAHGDTSEKTVEVPTVAAWWTGGPKTFRLKLSVMTTGDYEGWATPALASGGKVIASILPNEAAHPGEVFVKKVESVRGGAVVGGPVAAAPFWGYAGATLRVTIGRSGGDFGRIAVKAKTQDASTVGGINGLFATDFTYAKETFVWEDGDTADKTLEIPTFHVAGATYPRTFRLKLSAMTTGDYEGCATPELPAAKVIVSLTE